MFDNVWHQTYGTTHMAITKFTYEIIDDSIDLISYLFDIHYAIAEYAGMDLINGCVLNIIG